MNSVVFFFSGFPFSKTLVGVRPQGASPFGPPWGFSCSKVLGVSDVVAVEELAVVDNLHEHLKRSVGNLVIGDVGDTPTRAGRAVVVSGRVIRVVHDVLDIEELSVVAAAGDLADIMSTAPIAQSLVLVICPSEHLGQRGRSGGRRVEETDADEGRAWSQSHFQ